MKIANRIIVFLGAAAVFPVILTQMLVTVVLSIDKDSLIYGAAKLLLGDDNKLTGSRLGIEKTLIDLFDYFTGKTTSSFDFSLILKNIPAEFLPLKKFLIASIIFAVIGILITIVIMGCALFTKAYKTIIGLGLGGAASFLTSIILFGKVSKPLLDGSVDVASLVSPLFLDNSSLLGSLASGLLTGSVKVDVCGLGGAIYGAMFILFGVAAWELAYYLTLPKEEKTVKKTAKKSAKKITKKVTKKA